MKDYIRSIIMEKGIRSTFSIYISIILAYLEEYKWQDARRFMRILKGEPLEYEQKLVYYYLNELLLSKDKRVIKQFIEQLNSSIF